MVQFDAILDALLEKIRIKGSVKLQLHRISIITGEISTKAYVDIQKLVRDTVSE